MQPGRFRFLPSDSPRRHERCSRLRRDPKEKRSTRAPRAINTDETDLVAVDLVFFSVLLRHVSWNSQHPTAI